MLGCWLALILGQTSSGDEPADVVAPAAALARLRDPQTVYHTLEYAEYRRLRDAARRTDAATPLRVAAEVALDRANGQLLGTSRWLLPPRHGGAASLAPWDLRVASVAAEGSGETLAWGIAPDGALRVEGIPETAKALRIAWSAPAGPEDRPWTWRANVPDCALADLKVNLPDGWRCRSGGSFPDRGVLHVGGAAAWEVEFLPPTSAESHRPLATWRADHTVRLEADRATLETRVRVAIERAGLPALTFRVDPPLAPRPAGTVGRWRPGGAPEEWLLEFARPAPGIVEAVFAAEAGRDWLRSAPRLPSVAVAEALPREEAFEVSAARGVRLAALDGGAFRVVREGAEGDRYAARFVGPGGAAPKPLLRVEEPPHEVELAQEHFLDVGRDRVRHAVRLTWTAARGGVATATLAWPPGWTGHALAHGGAPAPAVYETQSDGAAVARFALPKPLAAGESLSAWASAERTLPRAARFDVRRLAAPDAALAGPERWQVRCDPAGAWRANAIGTLDDSPASAPPEGWAWPEAEVVRLALPPGAPLPLRNHGIGAGAALAAELAQAIRWNGQTWDLEGTLRLDAARSPLNVVLEANPTPPPLEWRSLTPGVAILSATLEPAAGNRPARARVRLSGPVAGPVALAYRGALAAPRCAAPLWRLPAARTFAVRHTVAAAPGAAARADAFELSESAEERDADAAAGALWRGRQGLWSPAARLEVRAEPVAGAAARARAVADLRWSNGRRILTAALALEVARPCRVGLRLPPGSHWRGSALDGRTAALAEDAGAAWLALAPGAQRLEFAAELGPGPPLAVEGCAIEAWTWTGAVGAADAVAADLRFEPVPAQAERLARRASADDAAAWRKLAEWWRRPLPAPLGRVEFVRRLRGELPPGWLLAVDLAWPNGGAALEAGPAEATPERLAERGGLAVALAPGVVALTRADGPAWDAAPASTTVEAWALRLGERLRRGDDALGRHATAAAWSAASGELVLPESVAGPGMSAATPMLDHEPLPPWPWWPWAAAGLGAGWAARVRWPRVALATAAVALAWLAWRSGFGAATGAAWAGGVAFACGTLPGSLRRGSAAAALAALALATSAGADDRTALIASDSGKPGELGPVQLGAARLAELKARAEVLPAVLLRSAEYRGRIVGERVRWTATLALRTPAAASAAQPVRVECGLDGLEVESVKVGGQPVAFLPPTPGKPLVAYLTKPGDLTAAIAFSTPLRQEGERRSAEFVAPAAASGMATLAGFAAPPALAEDDRHRGVRWSAGAGELSAELGPAARRVRLAWQTASAAPPRSLAIEAAQLLRPETPGGPLRELLVRGRMLGGPAPRVAFLAPAGTVFRSVTADGLHAWNPRADGRGIDLEFVPQAPTDVRIAMRALAPAAAPGRFAFPLVEPQADAVALHAAVAEATLPEEPSEERLATFRGVWTALGGDAALAGEAAFARDLSLAPRGWTAELPAATEGWSVAQTQRLALEGDGRTARWSATLDLAPRGPRAGPALALRLPPGVSVRNAAAPGLWQWFVRGDGALALRTEAPFAAPWKVELSGWCEPNSAAAPWRYAVRPLEPGSGGQLGAAQWEIAGPGLRIDAEASAEFAAEHDGATLTLRGQPGARAGTRVAVRPAGVATQVRSVYVVRQWEDPLVVEGYALIDLPGDAARVAAVAAPEWSEVEWLLPEGWAARDDGPRPDGRRWRLERLRPGPPGPLKAAWRARTALRPDVALPGVTFPGVPQTTRWYAAPKPAAWLAEAAEATRGPLPAPFDEHWDWPAPDDADTWLGGAAAVLRMRKSEAPAAPAALRIAAATLDLHEDATGVQGRSSWTVEGAAAAPLRIAVPEGAEVQQVRVGGALAPLGVEAGTLAAPLFRGGGRQQVVVSWRAPTRAAMPALLDAQPPARTLVRLSPAPAPGPHDATFAGWLLARWRNAADDLRARRGGDAALRARATALAARAQEALAAEGNAAGLAEFAAARAKLASTITLGEGPGVDDGDGGAWMPSGLRPGGVGYLSWPVGTPWPAAPATEAVVGDPFASRRWAAAALALAMGCMAWRRRSRTVG